MTMPIIPQAQLTVVAEFPKQYFLENLAVRSDGSILVTALNKKELWYVPSPNGDLPVTPVLMHTFDLLTLCVVETDPDVFLIVLCGGNSRRPRTPRDGDVGSDRAILRNAHRQHDRLVRRQVAHAPAVSVPAGARRYRRAGGDVGAAGRFRRRRDRHRHPLWWWPISGSLSRIADEGRSFSGLQPETARRSVSVTHARRPRSPHAPP